MRELEERECLQRMELSLYMKQQGQGPMEGMLYYDSDRASSTLVGFSMVY